MRSRLSILVDIERKAEVDNDEERQDVRDGVQRRYVGDEGDDHDDEAVGLGYVTELLEKTSRDEVEQRGLR